MRRGRGVLREGSPGKGGEGPGGPGVRLERPGREPPGFWGMVWQGWEHASGFRLELLQKNVLEGGAGWSSPPPWQQGAYAPLPVPRVQVLIHTLTFKPVQPPPDAGLASPRHLELSSVRSQACARRAAEAEAAGRTGGHEWTAVFAGALPIRRRHPGETGRGPAPQTGSGLLGRKSRPAHVTPLKATWLVAGPAGPSPSVLADWGRAGQRDARLGGGARPPNFPVSA